jgi:UDP-glucose 4-epimerase
MAKKVVVFGGSGFLGSHVADALTDIGYDVVVFDIKNSPYLKKTQRMVKGDIMDAKLVDSVVGGSEFVYNFAGIADIDESNGKPVDAVKVNILGNTFILEAARKAMVKRFVFASSVYVYSAAGSFYRSTKQACELLVENYHELYDLPYTILRYGSLYGSRSDSKNFIYQIIKQALTRSKITREGDGEEIREYIHVYDAAKGSVEILSEEFANQCVMVTGNQRMKMKDLLIMIREILGNKIEIEYIPSKSDLHYEITPYNFAPKIAKKLTNKTYFDIGEGILNCIQEAYKEIGLSCDNKATAARKEASD